MITLRVYECCGWKQKLAVLSLVCWPLGRDKLVTDACTSTSPSCLIESTLQARTLLCRRHFTTMMLFRLSSPLKSCVGRWIVSGQQCRYVDMYLLSCEFQIFIMYIQAFPIFMCNNRYWARCLCRSTDMYPNVIYFLMLQFIHGSLVVFSVITAHVCRLFTPVYCAVLDEQSRRAIRT